MKLCFTSSKSANRFNDWFAYQKSGFGIGSFSRKDLQRPLNEVSDIVSLVISSSESSVLHLSIWQRIKNFFFKFFKFFKR